MADLSRWTLPWSENKALAESSGASDSANAAKRRVNSGSRAIGLAGTVASVSAAR